VFGESSMTCRHLPRRRTGVVVKLLSKAGEALLGGWAPVWRIAGGRRAVDPSLPSALPRGGQTENQLAPATMRCPWPTHRTGA
jgi:hypothetical protein